MNTRPKIKLAELNPGNAKPADKLDSQLCEMQDSGQMMTAANAIDRVSARRWIIGAAQNNLVARQGQSADSDPIERVGDDRTETRLLRQRRRGGLRKRG